MVAPPGPHVPETTRAAVSCPGRVCTQTRDVANGTLTREPDLGSHEFLANEPVAAPSRSETQCNDAAPTICTSDTRAQTHDEFHESTCSTRSSNHSPRSASRPTTRSTDTPSLTNRSLPTMADAHLTRRHGFARPSRAATHRTIPTSDASGFSNGKEKRPPLSRGPFLNSYESGELALVVPNACLLTVLEDDREGVHATRGRLGDRDSHRQDLTVVV